jgi:hypothetical protein
MPINSSNATRLRGRKIHSTAPTDGQVLTYDTTNGWQPEDAGSGMTNPMTTAGDVIYGGASGAPTRLAKGTAGQVLTQGATNPAWADAGGGGSIARFIPKPIGGFGSLGTDVFTGNTTARIALINIPVEITVSKITVFSTAAGTAGTFKIAIFSENGGTKHIEITTGTISGSGYTTTSVSPSVVLSTGNYYLMMLPIGTASVTFRYFGAGFQSSATDEPWLFGGLTVTADTIPATFAPGDLTDEDLPPLIRLN